MITIPFIAITILFILWNIINSSIFASNWLNYIQDSHDNEKENRDRLKRHVDETILTSKQESNTDDGHCLEDEETEISREFLMNDDENNESELVDIRVAAEMGQVTRKLSLSRRQRIQQQRLRERVHKKAGKQVFGKRRLSSSDSITFRDRKYSVIGISDNNESIGDKPNLAHNMLNNNVIDEDSDIEVDQWLLQKRNSVRLERRPMAIFDMEKSAIQASIQLKVQQERRRMKHKEKIKLRLENRGYEDLLASSEDDEEVNLNTPDVF